QSLTEEREGVTASAVIGQLMSSICSTLTVVGLNLTGNKQWSSPDVYPQEVAADSRSPGASFTQNNVGDTEQGSIRNPAW
ncbi:hypothetical protein KAH43_01360, partial [Candidatus Bipolaricaulota bacterium]|nr:hypothetical protein [Candidatus Bipolaricaulota bacterium]